MAGSAPAGRKATVAARVSGGARAGIKTVDVMELCGQDLR